MLPHAKQRESDDTETEVLHLGYFSIKPRKRSFLLCGERSEAEIEWKFIQKEVSFLSNLRIKPQNKRFS
jgi:hypothetical protein